MFEMSGDVEKQLSAGGVAGLVGWLESRLRGRPTSAFHALLGSGFLPLAGDLADYVSAFVGHASGSHPIRSVYLEMNAFEINTGFWCLDAFGYETVGGVKDLDWLAAWNTHQPDSFELRGLENVQAVFGRFEQAGDQGLVGRVEKDTMELAYFLVMARFFELVERCVGLLRVRRNDASTVALFAAVHDWDVVRRFQ